MGSCIGTSPGENRGVPMNLTIYQDGKSTEVRPDAQRSEKIQSCVMKLLAGADDVLRLYVGEDRIASLRAHEHCVEIQYDSAMSFATKQFGTMKLTRVLLPLTGDLAGDAASPVATVIVGDPDYQSGPLRNPEGWPIALELDSLVESSMKSK